MLAYGLLSGLIFAPTIGVALDCSDVDLPKQCHLEDDCSLLSCEEDLKVFEFGLRVHLDACGDLKLGFEFLVEDKVVLSKTIGEGSSFDIPGLSYDVMVASVGLHANIEELRLDAERDKLAVNIAFSACYEILNKKKCLDLGDGADLSMSIPVDASHCDDKSTPAATPSAPSPPRTSTATSSGSSDDKKTTAKASAMPGVSTPSPSSSSSNGSVVAGPSGGAVAGIVIGVLCGVCGLMLIVGYILHKNGHHLPARLNALYSSTGGGGGYVYNNPYSIGNSSDIPYDALGTGGGDPDASYVAMSD